VDIETGWQMINIFLSFKSRRKPSHFMGRLFFDRNRKAGQ